MKSFFLLISIFICLSTQGLDERVEAGKTFYIDFPSLGKTWAKKDTRLGVYVPEDYSENKKFPLFVWFGGGKGSDSPNHPKKIVGGRGFICVGIPYYGGGKLYSNGGWETPWDYYVTMLSSLEQIVPNIDSQNRFCGGFSSGGAAITYLIGKSSGFRDYFYGFMPGGAGWPMGGLDKLKGRPMYAFMGAKDSRVNGYVRLNQEAEKVGIDITFLKFEGGHSMPSKHYGDMLAWINQKIVYRSLPTLKESLQKSLKSRKYGDVYKTARKILSIAAADMPESKEAEEAIAKVLPFGKSQAEKLNAAKVKLDIVKNFVSQWRGCDFVDELEKKCDDTAKTQLDKILSQRTVSTIYLKRFIAYWAGFSSADNALEKLDEMAEKAMSKIIESPNNNLSKFKALERFINDWTPSKVIETAKTKRQNLAATELEKIKQETGNRQKSNLKRFIRDFSGTIAAQEAERMVK